MHGKSGYVKLGQKRSSRRDPRSEANPQGCPQSPRETGKVAIPARKERPFSARAALIRRTRYGRLPVHRVRSASRSKPLPRAVGASRGFTGKVDESATGSVNFFGPTLLELSCSSAL